MGFGEGRAQAAVKAKRFGVGFEAFPAEGSDEGDTLWTLSVGIPLSRWVIGWGHGPSVGSPGHQSGPNRTDPDRYPTDTHWGRIRFRPWVGARRRFWGWVSGENP